MPERDDSEPAAGVPPPRPAPRTGTTGTRTAAQAQHAVEAAEDAALVRRARTGDERAFGTLVRRHVRSAQAAALVVLGDSEDAEDAVQDAFITALRKIEDCRPEEKFRPWLLTIVRNRAIDLRRRQRVRRAESLDAFGEGGSGSGGGTGGGEAAIASPAGGPLRDAERADARAHLAAALATLTDVRREVVVLHDLEGWSHREIGQHLGLAEGTVRAHLFWARRDLRRRLSAEWRRDDDEG